MRPSLSLAPTHKPKRNSTLRSLHLCHYCPLESIRTCKKAGQDAKSIRLASSKPQPKYAHLSSAVLKPNLGWTHNDPCLSLPFHGPLQLPRTWKRFQVVVTWPLAPFFCNIKTRQKPSQNISEQPDKKKSVATLIQAACFCTHAHPNVPSHPCQTDGKPATKTLSNTMTCHPCPQKRMIPTWSSHIPTNCALELHSVVTKNNFPVCLTDLPLVSAQAWQLCSKLLRYWVVLSGTEVLLKPTETLQNTHLQEGVAETPALRQTSCEWRQLCTCAVKDCLDMYRTCIHMYSYAAHRCNIGSNGSWAGPWCPCPLKQLFFSRSAHAIHTNAPCLKNV